jgi:molybdopterin synthase catalytic subunit
MRVRVLFFGMLRELVGRPSEEAEFPQGADLSAVFAWYAARHPRLQELAPSVVIARNQEFVPLTTTITEGDELAFLPPVSGGSANGCEISQEGHYFAITREAIDTRKTIARLLTGAEGAVVTFEGTVRNNTKGRPTRCLDYEGYQAMALKTMLKIGLEIAVKHQVGRIAMIHRMGRILIGETSVAIIVTAPHRQPALEAALEGIDRLKKLVPIWKKEHFVDGAVWVEGEWERDVPVVG